MVKESVSSLCGKIIISNFLPKIIKNHLKWGLRFLYFYYWLKNCEYCFKGIDMSQISPLNFGISGVISNYNAILKCHTT
jgi:hypothetical protein